MLDFFAHGTRRMAFGADQSAHGVHRFFWMCIEHGGKENIRRLSVQSVPGKFVCGEILEVECNDGFRTGPTAAATTCPSLGSDKFTSGSNRSQSSAMAIGKALQIASRKPRARTSAHAALP